MTNPTKIKLQIMRHSTYCRFIFMPAVGAAAVGGGSVGI